MATNGSKSVLHLPYFTSSTCHFLPHLCPPFPSPLHSKLCAPTELSMCTREARVILSFLRLLHERCWWPVAQRLATSKGQCWLLHHWAFPATGLWWENQKLPTHRTLTQTLWHRICWQILLSEWAIDLFSQYECAVYQGYYKRIPILLDDHRKQFLLPKRPPVPCFTMFFSYEAYSLSFL